MLPLRAHAYESMRERLFKGNIKILISAKAERQVNVARIKSSLLDRWVDEVIDFAR